MNNTLCLYTAEFPYGKGESFLEAEIIYLAQYFKQIYIFPYRTSEQKRDLPENIKILTVPTAKNYTTKKGFKYIGWWSVHYFFETIKLYPLKIALGAVLMKGFQNNVFYNFLKQHQLLNNTIHYSYWFAKWSTNLAILRSENKIKHFISRAHGYDLYTERNEHNYIPYRKFQLKYIDRLYLISKQGLEYISKKHPKYINKYRLAYLGTKDFGFRLKKVDASMPVIVSCSSIIPLKRLHLIAKALKNITFPVKWVHIGDGTEKSKILEICQTLPENIKVEFKGQLSNSKVLTYYKNNFITAFINVSSTEGLPVSIMEAISFGIPVIATNVGGVSEIVNQTTGKLIPKDIRIEELSSAITEVVLKNENWDRNLIRKFWENNFNAEKNYLKFVSEIKNIL